MFWFLLYIKVVARVPLENTSKAISSNLNNHKEIHKTLPLTLVYQNLPPCFLLVSFKPASKQNSFQISEIFFIS